MAWFIADQQTVTILDLGRLNSRLRDELDHMPPTMMAGGVENANPISFVPQA
ncbi:hypothetical protein BN873_460032 [Candidatus Competibacter denitrificans Run_A_D11]|uniref:Uncharacterized protein n=1 Tax=Candidatus Competibacter denitrificans Run_A_D11 TaxID=1400863 RepID=W6MDP6_9GAMM|nr:hypothetical protein BN873_460032 [Candidatus Competibacter denitrificans Run_A_D11]